MVTAKVSETSALKGKTAERSAHRPLRIGDAGDAYEREAERVADEVLSPSARKQHWSLSNIRLSAPLQSDGPSGECSECKQKRADHWAHQRKASSGVARGLAPPIVSKVLISAGKPLDKPALDFLERAYGQGLDDVRIHADEKASESAKAVDARACAVGKHVVFGEGEYAPWSRTGQRLLAHELTHILQQDGAPVLRRQPKPEEGGGTIRPLVQKFIRGEATEQEKQTLRDLSMSDQLRPEEVDALKQYLGRLIADQVVKQAVGGQGPININIGGPLGNVHTYFKAKVKLKLSGAAKVVGGGLEGTIETLAEVTVDKNKKTVTVNVTTPPGNTMLAELGKV
jgi:hypothetical protein